MGYFEWGGFSPKGDSEALVRRMRESDLFDEDGNLTSPVDESYWVISLGGRHTGKKSSYLEHYFRCFSEEKISYKKDFEEGNYKSGLGDFALQLLGSTKYKCDINYEKITEEVEKVANKMRKKTCQKENVSSHTNGMT